MTLTKDDLISVVSFLYTDRSMRHDNRASKRVWDILNKEGYLCRNNHRLLGEEDHFGPWSIHCQYHFFLDNQNEIASLFPEWLDLIKFDCQINQYADDNYDSIDTSRGGDGVPREFSIMLRSLPKSKLLTYFDKLDYMHGSRDLADFFFQRKIYLLAEYNIKSMIHINNDEPIDIDDECHLMVGNGFSLEVSAHGEDYSTLAVIENAQKYSTKTYHSSPTTIKEDFESVIKRINDIIMTKKPSELTESLRYNHSFCFIGEVSKYCDEIAKIHTCSLIIFRTCLARLYQENSLEWSDNYRINADLLSLEEFLYLLDALFNEHEKCLFKKGESITTIEIADYRYFSETISKRTEYWRMLLQAICAAEDSDGLASARHSLKHGRFLINANIVSCFTTNYDPLCEQFFGDRVEIVHLHGSPSEDDPTHQDLVFGIGCKEKSIEPEVLEKLSSIRGTLFVFGFSGDYDSHIIERIRENEAIKSIIFFQYKLEESLEKNPKMEQLFKFEAFKKFQSMRKDVVLVDSKRFFE